MLVAQSTHTGVEKPNNQDRAVSVGLSFACSGGPARFDLLIVADGMGGVAGGSIASAQTVSYMMEHIVLGLTGAYSVPRQSPTRGEDLGWLLHSAIEYANNAVHETGAANESLRGMGATVAVALAHGETLYVAHAGDCRVYRLRGDELWQITKDHTMVQLMLDQGKITAEEAYRHPNDFYITAAVGVDERLRVELQECDLKQGDIVFLGSDGAFKDLPTAATIDLAAALPTTPSLDDLQKFCDQVVGSALDPTIGASLDNVTAVAAYVDEIHPCHEQHELRVLPYGRELRPDPEAASRSAPVVRYGSASPYFRTYGVGGPVYTTSRLTRGQAELGDC